jgi:gluconate 5-dehydrogenase
MPEADRARLPVRSLFELGGRVAIVTGGATGIGYQMADALAEMGARVVVCARDEERCRRAAAELESHGNEALGLRCDAREPAEIKSVIERTCERFGQMDILVNNAGTTWAAPPEDMSLTGWEKVIAVNLTGVFLFSQAAGRVMIEQGRGKVINIASIMATRGAPPNVIDAIAYNTSKGGVMTFTRDLACKWARYGINVNAIAPGWFPSIMSDVVIEDRGQALLERIPLGRFGGPQDLQGAIVYLASAASDFATGMTIVVDGGQIAQ